MVKTGVFLLASFTINLKNGVPLQQRKLLVFVSRLEPGSLILHLGLGHGTSGSSDMELDEGRLSSQALGDGELKKRCKSVAIQKRIRWIS